MNSEAAYMCCLNLLYSRKIKWTLLHSVFIVALNFRCALCHNCLHDVVVFICLFVSRCFYMFAATLHASCAEI